MVVAGLMSKNVTICLIIKVLKMKKVILTVGAPGAGKSTWATEQAKNPKTLIVCRDDLRNMFFGGEYKYSREKEKAVTQHVKQVIEQFLEQDHFDKLIIADTNLSESTRNGYKKLVETKNNRIRTSGLKVPTIAIEEVPFDVPWIELEKRNTKRGNKAVPKAVLRDFYLRMQKYLDKHKQYVPNPDRPNKKCVIFDLDGTLADNSHRGAFEYDKLVDDKPNEFVVNIARMYKAQGYCVIVVSGRNRGDKTNNNKYWRMTSEWLEKHDIPCEALFMREWNDHRSDDIVKEEIFWNKIEPIAEVVGCFDDRDRVVEMWRRIGIPCAQVNFGEF